MSFLTGGSTHWLAPLFLRNFSRCPNLLLEQSEVVLSQSGLPGRHASLLGSTHWITPLFFYQELGNVKVSIAASKMKGYPLEFDQLFCQGT